MARRLALAQCGEMDNKESSRELQWDSIKGNSVFIIFKTMEDCRRIQNGAFVPSQDH